MEDLERHNKKTKTMEKRSDKLETEHEICCTGYMAWL